MERRQFVKLAGAVVCAGIGGCAGSGSGHVWTGPTSFDIGTGADYPKDGIYSQFEKKGGFFIISEAGRLYTVSSICTHKECDLDIKGKELICDCHGSRFTPKGVVLTGPATRSLEHFGISKGADGRLTVDRTRAYPEGNWESAGAFVTI